MNTLRKLCSVALFPAMVFGITGACIWVLESGRRDLFQTIHLTTISAGFVALFGLERLFAHRREWNEGRDRDFWTDLLHNVFGAISFPTRLAIRVAILTATVAWLASAVGTTGVWPSTWPLVTRAALLVLLGEFFYYWAHRLAHEVEPLWRLHATHHSPTRLYWFNADRFHPFDLLVLGAARAIPAVALSADVDAIAIQSLLVSVCGKLQHVNVELALRPWNGLFATADWHRWHHSTIQTHCNYGNTLIVWDRIFRSAYRPTDGSGPENVGLADMPAFPTGFVGQLLSPFLWRRLERLSAQTTTAARAAQTGTP